MRKGKHEKLTPGQEKAKSFLEENKDIPNLAKVCVYFGIEREDLVKELRLLVSEFIPTKLKAGDRLLFMSNIAKDSENGYIDEING